MPGTEGGRWRSVEAVCAGIGILLVAGIYYASRSYPELPWSLGGPPGFYPRFLAAILAGLCVALFVEGLLRPTPVRLPSGTRALRLLAVTALLGGSPWLVGWLGFRAGGILFLLAAMLLLGEGRAWRPRDLLILPAVAVAGTLILYLIFEVGARTPLPRGALWG